MRDDQAAAVAKALSNRLRIEMLRALRDRKTLSAVEYSRESGQPLGNASYHMRVLADAGVISPSGMVQRRGAMEHRYALDGARAKAALGVLDLLAGA